MRLFKRVTHFRNFCKVLPLRAVPRTFKLFAVLIDKSPCFRTFPCSQVLFQNVFQHSVLLAKGSGNKLKEVLKMNREQKQTKTIVIVTLEDLKTEEQLISYIQLSLSCNRKKDNILKELLLSCRNFSTLEVVDCFLEASLNLQKLKKEVF